MMRFQNVKALALGQILSLLITGTAFSSALLVRHGINAPTLQSFFNYILLAAVNGCCLLRRQKRLKVGILVNGLAFQVQWYIYLLLACVDMEANYFATKAYQYTSITSVMLLDCWTIPCVLLLTWLLLNTRYLRGHILGVNLCVLGLALVLLSDAHSGDRSGGSNVLVGDTLVLLAATLYAVSNVFEVLPFIAFAGCLFAFSTLVPQLLQVLFYPCLYDCTAENQEAYSV